MSGDTELYVMSHLRHINILSYFKSRFNPAHSIISYI